MCKCVCECECVMSMTALRGGAGQMTQSISPLVAIYPHTRPFGLCSSRGGISSVQYHGRVRDC